MKTRNIFNLKKHNDLLSEVPEVDVMDVNISQLSDGSFGLFADNTLIGSCSDAESAVNILKVINYLKTEMTGILMAQSTCDDIDIEKEMRRYRKDNYQMALKLHGKHKPDDSPFIPIP